jgi:hypothetical protein
MLKQTSLLKMVNVKRAQTPHQNAESVARAIVMAVTAENAMPTQTVTLATIRKRRQLLVKTQHKRMRLLHAPTLNVLQAPKLLRLL